jgi:hypothetical protein
VLNTFIRRRRAPLAASLLVGACLAIADGTTAYAAPPPAPYTVPLHQPTPITAAGFGSHERVCDSIPSTEDGWHFVLPGDFTHFVSLTVTFNPGGTQTITTFGPPSDKHAYAGSAPGAQLTAASAVVTTDAGKKRVRWFNLSDTCPATVTPTPTPTHTHKPPHHKHHHHHKRHHKHHHLVPPAPVPSPVRNEFPVTG